MRNGEVQTRILTTDPTAAARHAAAGRRPPKGEPTEPSAAMRDAWREAHGRTVECPRCGHLVGYEPRYPSLTHLSDEDAHQLGV